ncbi:MAG: amidohydrolase family protein [Pirellulales bacterium]|nr:amidohydrolase family protein [Pirellulales bacterium]
MPSRQILRARYVFPVVGEPIENGFVSVEGARIAEVGKIPPRGERIDLGNVALLPGLVNAHAHLEFCGLSQPLGAAGMAFVDWIRNVIEWRECNALDRNAALAAGLRECMREGVACVGNISQFDEPQSAFDDSSIDGIRFFELIAPNRERKPPVLDFFRNRFPQRQAETSKNPWRLGLSPHAPYSVHPDLLQSVVDFSADRKVPLAMHLAESREEMQLLREGTGPFREFLEERKLFDPAVFPGGKRPRDYLRQLAAAARALVVHGNYLDEEEIAYLAENSARMAVVYCPRTHAYFRHDPYPLEKMLTAGAAVALGTDSPASAPDLSILAEMRFAAKRHPRIGRERILRMGTLDAARALGRADEIGSLEAGKAATFAVVALPDETLGDPHRLLLESAGSVVQTWIRGRPIPVDHRTIEP